LGDSEEAEDFREVEVHSEAAVLPEAGNRIETA